MSYSDIVKKVLTKDLKEIYDRAFEKVIGKVMRMVRMITGYGTTVQSAVSGYTCIRTMKTTRL
ncbi:MAG: hypothetical protein QXP68_04255 [Thermosphaera sp.]